MLVIVGSILYFFAVLFSEIGVGLGCTLCACGKGKKNPLDEDETKGRATSIDIEMHTGATAANPMHAADDNEAELQKSLDQQQETILKMAQEMKEVSTPNIYDTIVYLRKYLTDEEAASNQRLNVLQQKSESWHQIRKFQKKEEGSKEKVFW